MQGLYAGGPTIAGETGALLRETIQSRIRSGEWSEGTKLPGERALAAQFGVSRAVVREVLHSLAAQGTLQISPARGAFVARPDGRLLTRTFSSVIHTQGATVRDVAEARMGLEGEMASRAAARPRARIIEVMRAVAERTDRLDDKISQAIEDLKFHSLVGVVADNPVLVAMHRSIAPWVLLMNLRSVRVHEERSVQHVDITEAIAAGDSERARVLSVNHLLLVEEHFGDDYDRPVEAVAAENLRRISSGLVSLESVEQAAFGELEELMKELAAQP